MENRDLIEKLNAEKALTKPQWMQLISSYTDADRELARATAQDIALRHFGRNVFFRGIVEFTNYCKNDCLYCGIRRDDLDVQRYRLSAEDILECCREGYGAGFRTFVLQGGEDPYYTDDIMTDIVSAIRAEFPDCAITLSIGEKSRESYQRYYDAGANRYLLRHETANPEHYAKMHPAAQTFENRMRCLRDLKDIGYQTGAGMMVGAPYQTAATLADDMMFLGAFRPQMIGMGPFIPHHGTPFRNFPAGGKEDTLFLLSLCRIMLPSVLLPATTALGTVSGDGRKLGVLAGANVIMPNLSPISQRKKYMLYDNKAITGEDAAESLAVLQKHLDEIGYSLVVSRGDYKEERP
jgi:biotin synthase